MRTKNYVQLSNHPREPCLAGWLDDRLLSACGSCRLPPSGRVKTKTRKRETTPLMSGHHEQHGIESKQERRRRKSPLLQMIDTREEGNNSSSSAGETTSSSSPWFYNEFSVLACRGERKEGRKGSFLSLPCLSLRTQRASLAALFQGNKWKQGVGRSGGRSTTKSLFGTGRKKRNFGD